MKLRYPFYVRSLSHSPTFSNWTSGPRAASSILLSLTSLSFSSHPIPSVSHSPTSMKLDDPFYSFTCRNPSNHSTHTRVCWFPLLERQGSLAEWRLARRASERGEGGTCFSSNSSFLSSLSLSLSLSRPLAGIVPFDGCCDFAFAFLPSFGRSVDRSGGRSSEAIYKRAT